MLRIRRLLLLIIFFSLLGCNPYIKNIDNGIDYLYANALSKFNDGKLDESLSSFKIIVDNYPYKEEAIEAQVFIIWIHYLRDDYLDAELNIDTFLRYYVFNQYTDWATYMKALITYEQMGAVDVDQSSTVEALRLFSNIYKKYQNTDRQRDAFYRIGVIKNRLAFRNMNISYHYLRQKNYIAAMSRYEEVMVNFQDTIFVQEAMYRLVYLWMTLGVEEEAFRITAVLGYNYPSSYWYAKSLEIMTKYSKKPLEDLKKNPDLGRK